MSKRLILVSVLTIVLLGWYLPLMADESTTDQADNIVPSAPAKPPGDILWHCDVQSIPDDDQILGVETLRDTIYITGAGGTTHPDTNKVHVWTIPGNVCTYQYTVDQPTTSSWGWRDIACDGQYLYASDDRTLDCFYVTPGGVVTVPANNVTIIGMADIAVIRAVAYDEDHDWFWTADFSSNIYAFDRSGNMTAGPFASGLSHYGMAYDNTTPGGPFLWVHVQDSCNVYQFDPSTGVYTGVVYSGWGDDDPGVSGIAGGLAVTEGDPSKGKASVTLVGITQMVGSFDEMYFMEIYVSPEEQWPNHKMHFPQLPDLEGWDVYAVFPKTLADDWQCSATGDVLDIHFWGSWKDVDGDPYTDDFYTPMPWFGLSIHSNLPVGHPDNPFPYSIPGELLWWWDGEIEGLPFEPPAMEHWFNPNTGEVLYNDHVPYWRYDFFFDQASPPPEPFFQYQDSIYWLNIAVEPSTSPPPYEWGWKTSRDHFMDDAVYTDNPPDGPWYEMYEPPRANWFDVYFNSFGEPEDMGSTNYYGQGWYFYEWYYWWNMWFYDNPYNPDQEKHFSLDFMIYEEGPAPYAEFAINLTTPEWDEMGMGRPPLPEDGEEDIYIVRIEYPVYPGPNYIEDIIPWNPEWISIDFRATDVAIVGWIWHECVQTSMDMAFVITGEEGGPEDSLYWKPDHEDYAPSGMPDFDQKQDNWWKDYTGNWTFCGPVAVANCFWWFDSKYNVPPGVPGDGNDQFPLVRDYMDALAPFIPPATDDHDPWNVDHAATPWLFGATPPPPATPQPFVPGPQPQPSGMPPWGELVERLAWYFDTDGVRTGYCAFSGTYVDDMQDGIDQWFRDEGVDDILCEVTTAMPTFAYVESLVEKCEDVILLLGFWFEVAPGEWYREGGHYVTVAGINSEQGLIGISDPYYDNAEAGGRGRVRNGTLIPHAPVPGHAATVHNDAGNVSHDIYGIVDPSPSPGGLWALDGYPPGGKSALSDWMSTFYNQNVPREFKSVTAPWDQRQGIHTEVEYCVHISPWDYRGDVNVPGGDGVIDAADIVFLINHVFTGTSAPTPYYSGDCNCDGIIDVADIILLINHVFGGTSAPRCCDP